MVRSCQYIAVCREKQASGGFLSIGSKETVNFHYIYNHLQPAGFIYT